MRVTLLGTGTAVPVADRLPAGVLVESGATTVAVDLGPGVLRRLAASGAGPERLSAVLLTHFHVDHSGDLPALLFALRSPYFAGRPPLCVVGGRGLRRFLALLDEAWCGKLTARGYELAVDERGAGEFAIGGLRVEAFEIAHTPESLAYRIADAAGRVVAVSGDATPCAGLVEAARDADLFVCEAAFPDIAPNPHHLTPALAADAARRAGAKRLCLTHLYPECEVLDHAAQARAGFGGEVVLGRDLMRFDV